MSLQLRLILLLGREQEARGHTPVDQGLLKKLSALARIGLDYLRLALLTALFQRRQVTLIQE